MLSQPSFLYTLPLSGHSAPKYAQPSEVTWRQRFRMTCLSPCPCSEQPEKSSSHFTVWQPNQVGVKNGLRSLIACFESYMLPQIKFSGLLMNPGRAPRDTTENVLTPRANQAEAAIQEINCRLGLG